MGIDFAVDGVMNVELLVVDLKACSDVVQLVSTV